MQPTQGSHFTQSEGFLAVSLELSKNSWKIALHDGRRDKPAIHAVGSERAAKRLAEVVVVIEGTKKKWGLSEQTRVVIRNCPLIVSLF